MPQDSGKSDEESSGGSMGEELGNLTPETEEQIIRLQSRLDAIKKVIAVSNHMSSSEVLK
jgi:hypothetical protein